MVKSFAPPLLIELALVIMANVGLLRSQLPWLALAWCLAFAGLMLAWRHRAVVFRGPVRMLAWAVVFRVTLLPCVPDLSDDFYRYIWDGWLSSEGVNPYRYTPNDPALADFARQFPFDRLNSRDLHSVYPPLTQAVCAVAGAVYSRLGFFAAFVAMKAIFVVMELVGIACLVSAVMRTAQPRSLESGRAEAAGLVALYAWNPLAILAIAGQGHGEAGLVFGIGLAAWAMSRGLPRLSWAGLALAVLAKLTPLLVAPLWWRYWHGKSKDENAAVPSAGVSSTIGLWIRSGAWSGIVVLVAFIAPFWFGELPGNYLSSLRLYVQWFEFNGPVYGLIKWTIRLLADYDSSKQLGPALALVTLMVAWRVWRLPADGACESPVLLERVGSAGVHGGQARRLNGVFDRYAIIIAAFLLLATTVHPWYALAALVLTPLSPVLRWSWVWFSFASFATYFSYNAQGSLHAWHGLLSAFVWIGFAVVACCEHGAAIVDAVLRRRGRRKAVQIAPHVAGISVLDLGCGEGYVASALMSEMPGGSVPGTIVLCDVVDVNRTALPHVVYDGRRLPFADGSFDTTVLSLALHHCAQPAQVIAEAKRVSRRRVIVTESTYGGVIDRVLIELLDRLANRLRPGAMREQERHLCFRTVAQWREMFESAGLRVVEVRWLNRVMHKHVMFVLDVEAADADRHA